MDNLIMRSVINVFNDGSSRIETDLSEATLNEASVELSNRGYECSIHSENNQTFFVVKRKSEGNG